MRPVELLNAAICIKWIAQIKKNIQLDGFGKIKEIQIIKNALKIYRKKQKIVENDKKVTL